MDVDLGEMIKDSRFIGMQLSSVGSRTLHGQGLTPIQARVLIYILKHSDEGTSLTDIHHETGYTMAAASGLIKRLRENGFVRVEACKLDERRKLLFPTEKGRQVSKLMDMYMDELSNKLYKGFSDEELKTLDRLQKKMIHNLSASNNCNLEG